MSYQQDLSKNITAILNGYDHNLYNEQEMEDLSNLSLVILQKKVKKLNEQIIYLHAENRLLHNYLIWYEKKIVPHQDKRISENILLPNKIKPLSHKILKHKTKQPLSIEKKREIAEAICKVLFAYNQKYGINITQYVDECINTLETDGETIIHLEHELITLKKFIQKMNIDLISTQKRFTAEEFFEYIHDRMHYLEALNERKWQKTVRLRFNIDGTEKSIRKVRQIVDTITEVDFEQLKIDIDKQLKEVNIKNKMLIFYKRQQSEANMKLNAKKPELFKELRTLVSLRKEINNRIQLVKYYNEIKQKMLYEIRQYEKINEQLQEIAVTYRVPSIPNYVDLKSKQINLRRNIHVWERKVQIVQHELHLRQIETIHNPEKIFHPWKYLQNPSSVLFYQHYQTSSNRITEIHETNKAKTQLKKNFQLIS
ncbi:hypothetical protein I4U23_018879 [Adineta vaga]|nr:hypothetical protein I4U23_018879 [Adineta vaga]